MIVSTLSIISIIAGLFSLALCVFYVLCFWKLFEKAGEPGWKCIIPIYNLVVWLKITKAGLWFMVSIMTSIIFSIISIIQNDLAVIGSIIVLVVMIVSNFILYHSMFKAYGKGIGYTILSLFFGFITVPMMAFGKSEYVYNKQTAKKQEIKTNVNSNSPMVEDTLATNTGPKPTKLPPRQPKIAPVTTNNTDNSTSFHTEQQPINENQSDDDFILEDDNVDQPDNNLNDDFTDSSNQDNFLDLDNDNFEEDNKEDTLSNDEDIFIEPIE